MNIIRTEQHTSNRVATTIVEQDERTWVVRCEGCGRPSRQDKVSYRPVNPSDALTKPLDEIDMIEIVNTAPYAARCIPCGPFTS